jgi:hypothetical protein
LPDAVSGTMGWHVGTDTDDEVLDVAGVLADVVVA